MTEAVRERHPALEDPDRRPPARWKLCTLLRCTCNCDLNGVPVEIPIYHSSICSLIHFSWLTPFIWRSYKKGAVDSDDIWPFPSADSCRVVVPRWEQCVKHEVARQNKARQAAHGHQNVQLEAESPRNRKAVQSASASPSSKDAEQAKGQPKLNLARAVLHFQISTLFSVLFLRLMTLIVVIVSAMYGLRTLIREVEDGRMSLYFGVLALLVLVLLMLCKSVLWSQAFCVGGIAGARLRGAVLFLCLHKMLKSKSLLSIRPTITNIFANDSRHFLDLSTHITTLVSALTMVVAVSACGIFIVGPWSLIATAVFLVYIPVEFLISSVIMRYRRRTQHLVDQRLDIMRELLASIRPVKFLGLESFFYRKILRIWRQEMSCLRTSWMLSSLSVSLVFTIPLLASVFTFLPHILLGNRLDAAQAFVFVGLWAAARQFVHMIPNSMKGLNDARVAAYRLSRVFYLPELSELPAPPVTSESAGDAPVVIELNNLTATYPKAPRGLRKPRRNNQHSHSRRQKNNDDHSEGVVESEVVSDFPAINNAALSNGATDANDAASDRPNTPCPSDQKSGERQNALNSLNLTIKKGQFIGVCGKVGSGKSTLINAILGRLETISGSICVSQSSTAVVMQDAWLFNGSIRENILFGAPYDAERYNKVISNCGLILDLDTMEDGDCTELTEYGANLSGGQRQRVSLARALYASALLILLDDPLSAVDNALSKQVFDDALMPLRGNATVIFVSHRLEFLAKCDVIAVMREGTITECGTHTELLGKAGGDYLALVHSFYRQRKQTITDDELFDVNNLPEEEEEAFELGKLTSLVTKAAAGLVLDDHPLDVPVPNDQRVEQPTLPADADSLTAEVGAKVILAKVRAASATKKANGLSPTEDISLTAVNGNCQKADTAVVGDKTPTEKKPVVFESLFRSRGDISTNADTSRRGTLSIATYLAYARAGGHPILLTLVLLGYVFTHGLVAFTKYWLAYWLKQGGGTVQSTFLNITEFNETVTYVPENVTVLMKSSDLSTNSDVHFYALVYVSCAVGVLFAAVLKSCLVAMVCLVSYFFLPVVTIICALDQFALRASNNTHKLLLSKLLSCPLSFFERTKSGTIIARFAKDMDDLTSRLPASLETLLSNLSVLITANVTISVVIPWFAICCAVLIVICFFIFRVAQSALRDLKRVEAHSLQPLLSLLASVVAGSPVITAFNRNEMFLSRAAALIDRTSAVMTLFQFSGRWLSWRLDLLVNFLIAVVGSLVLGMRTEMAPAFAGLALSMLIEMSGILQVATRMFLNTETSFVAVERLLSFEKRLPFEPLDEEPSTPAAAKKPPTVVVVNGDKNESAAVTTGLLSNTLSPEWPSDGAVTFESVSLSYASDRDNAGVSAIGSLALDNVSFEIKPREFIAVVGRSGSGKSSLTAVLTRLYGIANGRILIDGVDIAQVGLTHLRKSVSVVPQEPCIFSGTIRTNLDPYHEHSDDALWAALERCAMKSKIQDRAARYFCSTDSVAAGGDMYLGSGSVSSSRWNNYPTLFQSFTGKQNNPPAALNMPLNSNDVRFSTGERQLLCLARALVRDSAILILDEATASIDAETENRIQATLAVEAHKRTIITIVHRMESILSPTSRCDRVMLMDSGRLVDICDASTMRQRNAETSHFARMAHMGSSL